MCRLGGVISLEDVEAVIQARVSDNRDGRSRSTDQQVDAAKRWCERNGVPIAKIVIEDDIGASRYSRKSRAAYEDILANELQPRNGKRRILVSYESSRAQRNLEVYVRLRKVCEQTGALWCYDGRVYDLTDADDRRRTAQDAVDDEYEVERTRKRSMRDIQDSAIGGRPHGRLKYGYRIVRDSRTGVALRREFDPEQEPVVRQIARRILAGESAWSIARDLEARKVPAPQPRKDGSPGQWKPGSVTRMMRSPTYAGKRVHKGEVVADGSWPAILTAAEHDKIVALLSNPARLTHRGTDPRWLVSGWARCGVCGGVMRPIKPRGYYAYTCMENFCTSRAANRLDRLVEEAILQRLESPDVLEVLAGDDDEAESAFEEARSLRTRLDGFIDQAAEGSLSPQALARIEAKLKPQIAAAERRARASLRSPLLAETIGPDARAIWAKTSMADRRELVRSLAEVVVFRPPQSGMRFDPRYIGLKWMGSPKEPQPPQIVPLADGGNPADYTAPEVLEYLRGVGFRERVRVIEAEREGHARGAIMRLSLNPEKARPGSS